MTQTLIGTQLRGPKNLLETIELDPQGNTLTVLALDDDRRVQFLENLDLANAEVPAWPEIPETTAGIVAIWHSQEEVRIGRELLLSLQSSAPAHVLDLLLVSNGRWWSAICDDPNCCPVEGTAIRADAEEAIQQSILRWRRAITNSNVFEILGKESSISQIEVRDAILISLCDPADRNAWLKFSTLIFDSDNANDFGPDTKAALWCIEASANYLEGNLAQAERAVAQAVAAVPEYSLARLLRSGLNQEAPPSLLFDALAAAEGKKSKPKAKVKGSKTKGLAAEGFPSRDNQTKEKPNQETGEN